MPLRADSKPVDRLMRPVHEEGKMRFDNVQILSVSHIDAPHPESSDEIESMLAATMKRLGVPPGMLERFSGIKSRRQFDEAMPPSQATATRALAMTVRSS